MISWEAQATLGKGLGFDSIGATGSCEEHSVDMERLDGFLVNFCYHDLKAFIVRIVPSNVVACTPGGIMVRFLVFPM